MKTASGLTVITVGAVLAFAVNGHPWFLNLQVCGWILLLIGVIGLVIPRRGYGWLRRQVVVRRDTGSRRVAGIRQRRNPSYIMIDPAAAGLAGSTDADATAVPDNATVVPDKETVEEFFQD